MSEFLHSKHSLENGGRTDMEETNRDRDIKKSKVAKKRSIYDEIPEMDKKRALKYIVRGIILVVIFGMVMLASSAVSGYSDTWGEIQREENSRNYWDGDYGYDEYTERDHDISQTERWMTYQSMFFLIVGRLGIYLGFLSVFIGLLGFVTNEKLDQRTRWTCLILAGVIIVAMLLTFLIGFSATINVS